MRNAIGEKCRCRRRIKVLRIKARLTIGGPDLHVLLLNTGLDRERFESYLAVGTVTEGEPDMTFLAEEMGVKLFVMPELKSKIAPIDDFIAFLKLYRLMRKLKPHIVHTHTAKAGALGRAAAALNKVPVRIHTYHGHIFHSYFGRLKTSFFLMLERALAGLTDRIIVISRRQLNDVTDTYKISDRRKCSLIPLGLDLKPFLDTGRGAQRGDSAYAYGSIRKRFHIDKDTLLIATVGRLVEVKNIKMFLDTAKSVKIKAPRIKTKFLVVGDGVLRDALESYTKTLKMEDSVIFTGWFKDLTGRRRDMASLYGDLDIVALTSLNEGTPISLIEAMAAGKAVVSTDVGGVRDVVVHEESGLLSPAGDVESFSSNLLILLHDEKKRAEMGRKGRAFVSKRFSEERLIKDIEKLYEESLGQKEALTEP